MNKKQREIAFNIVVKYGLCNECNLKLGGATCREQGCYQNGVKIIREMMFCNEAEENS